MNTQHFVSLLYTIIFQFSVLCIQSCFSLKLALVTDPSLWFEAHNFLSIAFFSIFFSQILMKLLLLGVYQRTKFHGEWKVDFGWGGWYRPPLTPAWSILYVTPLRIKYLGHTTTNIRGWHKNVFSEFLRFNQPKSCLNLLRLQSNQLKQC